MIPNRLIFVRHGETDWNSEGRLQGQYDVPLNPRGRGQAGSAGRSLRRWLGADADVTLAATDFVASPLGRTCETMELLRRALRLPPRPYALDARLKELTFGAWEGLTWPEIKRRDPAGYRARKSDKWNFAPPGGESYAMLATRVAAWLEALDRDTLAVSHGGVARVLMHRLAGIAPEEACAAAIPQGRALLFEGEGWGWI